MSDLADSVHQFAIPADPHHHPDGEDRDLVQKDQLPEDRRGCLGGAHRRRHGGTWIVRAAPGHVDTVRQNFVDEVMSSDDYVALGRAFAAVIDAGQYAGLVSFFRPLRPKAGRFLGFVRAVLPAGLGAVSATEFEAVSASAFDPAWVASLGV